jgi:DNA-binding CsgD family transcriptional regulator
MDGEWLSGAFRPEVGARERLESIEGILVSPLREIPPELLDSAYEAAVAPERWPRFLEQLAPHINAATLHIVLRFPSDGERGAAYSFGAKPEFERSYVERFLEHDPWRARAAATPGGAVSTGERLLASSDLERSEFYRGWMEPQDLLHPVGALLHKPDGEARSLLAAFRRKSDEPFGPGDLAFVKGLVPHLQRVLAIHRALRAAESVRDAALETLDRLPEGWILLAPDASVLATNRSARQILERGDALRLAGGRLAASAEASRQRLRDLLARALDTGSAPTGGAIELASPLGESLHVVSSPLRNAHADADHSAAAVVFVSVPDAGGEQTVDQLRNVYGLTHAEGRVARRLAEGQRLSEISRDLGISINTVRGHLKQVFAKTGTHRQAELVRLVLSGRRQRRAAG